MRKLEKQCTDNVREQVKKIAQAKHNEEKADQGSSEMGKSNAIARSQQN